VSKVEGRGEVLGLIPARGGSKSIPLKNMAMLGGEPLIDFVISSAQSSGLLHRVICSTDSDLIAGFCRDKGVEVVRRPDTLAGDETPVVDVVRHVLEVYTKHPEGYPLPEIIVLLQPTSPFVLPEHIEGCVEALWSDKEANSVQTISRMPHNYHAYNQREINNGYVEFRFPDLRARCYNKQRKPELYVFGNLVATRTSAFLQTNQLFCAPSIGVEVPVEYALDVDGPADLEVAEWMLQTGRVNVAHRSSS